MKEYIKLFNGINSADGYPITATPFTSTVKRESEGLGPQNVRCNEEGKKLVAGPGGVVVEDAPTLYTLTWLTEGYANWLNTPSQAAGGETISAEYHVFATPTARISINDGEVTQTGARSGIFTFTMPSQNTTVLLCGGGGQN